ncbi:hypothetical protein P691DRAFT_670651 [Macrolepiota fuliginosa MF-IS2]|uniref:F-box domain-containing protein n=1 Tax=Macrolepiota fuliginosa MF-IS2 TaxID=1400762 RepID=A0A9P5XD13_9AGAR|nr:hypothetical protein P691DRAFT_670651 [Macrolepiota fuliginosa MF-IS2]
MASPLHAVPHEILSNIAIFLANITPYSPPTDLLALQATDRCIHNALNPHSAPSVWAAAFRFRFDDAAVLRRNFHPNGRDYADQLRQYSETLAAVRTLNVLRDDMDEVMRNVYTMLLDNNGKNRAQLEANDADRFMDIFVRTRLWAQAHVHEGWPDAGCTNTYALWNLWFLTTLDKLRGEVRAHREHLVALILPYVLNPYRYHQAEAPPSHFHLPLPTHQGNIVFPHSLPSAHGPYPVYVDPQPIALPYFGAMPQFSPPPITAAAKLLYFARREVIPLDIPPHLPRTRAEAPPASEPQPTQEDLVEINNHRGAEPPLRVTWDWESDRKLVNGIPTNPQSNFDDSTRWDADYWRRRFCGNAWQSQPKWRPGKVYIPGSMDGLWQGRLVFPNEAAMRNLVEHAPYPQLQNFNETSLRLTHQPLFMRLKEYHAVSTNPSVPLPPTSSHLNSAAAAAANDDLSEWSDLSMRNAWFPGGPGNVSFINHRHPPRNSLLYSPPGHARNILVTVDEAYRHEGCENCEMCREREALVRKGMELDQADQECISEAYSEDCMSIERMFESVGLGRDQVGPDEEEESGMDEDEDFVGGDADVEVGGVLEEEAKEELEFLDDPNADADCQNPPTRPVRRGTDRARVEQCDGVRDIIFSGTTDRRHALAWNDHTFYGRVRPWDGLIGILRLSNWPRPNPVFFYGYLVGDETFVGNWRFAALDPNIPAWESAFVMSRRVDDEGNDDD